MTTQSITFSDGEKTYELNDDLVSAMFQILKEMDHEFSVICEVDPSLMEDVNILLSEIEEYLIEE